MSSSLTFMELLPKIRVPAERACGSRFIAMQWEVGSRGRQYHDEGTRVSLLRGNVC